jgi:hypothetical protein
LAFFQAFAPQSHWRVASRYRLIVFAPEGYPSPASINE